MTDFTDFPDLASERLGGAAVAANDEFFAPRENLVKPDRPIFREGIYTDHGKWMDGWETRRRREPGHDWCIVRLGLPGRVRGIVIDTAHFQGNFPEACSVDACAIGPDRGLESPETQDAAWGELVARSALSGDCENRFEVDSDLRVTHVRLNIFPDGGVARLRVHGEVLPDWERIRRAGEEVDLAAIENGGVVVAASDMFFGSRHNLILPGPGRGMSDGWETRRRRGPGNDWAIVRLGAPGTVRRVEVDTTHFQGNAPGECSIEVAFAPDILVPDFGGERMPWKEILARTRVRPHALQAFDREVSEAAGEATHARLNIYPDGGVSRLRFFGTPSAARRK